MSFALTRTDWQPRSFPPHYSTSTQKVTQSVNQSQVNQSASHKSVSQSVSVNQSVSHNPVTRLIRQSISTAVNQSDRYVCWLVIYTLNISHPSFSHSVGHLVSQSVTRSQASQLVRSVCQSVKYLHSQFQSVSQSISHNPISQ